MKTCRKGHTHDNRQCPVCNAARNRRYYEASRVRLLERKREIRRQSARRCRSVDPEAYRTREREKRAANRAQVREVTRVWRLQNPERVARYRQRTAAWKKSNPVRVRELNARHEARKRGVEITPVTPAHLRLLFEAQDGRCRYCRTPLGSNKHLDHRIPLSRGGEHAPDNVCWACSKCNLRKYVSTEREFLAARAA